MKIFCGWKWEHLLDHCVVLLWISSLMEVLFPYQALPRSHLFEFEPVFEPVSGVVVCLRVVAFHHPTCLRFLGEIHLPCNWVEWFCCVNEPCSSAQCNVKSTLIFEMLICQSFCRVDWPQTIHCYTCRHSLNNDPYQLCSFETYDTTCCRPS